MITNFTYSLSIKIYLEAINRCLYISRDKSIPSNLQHKRVFLNGLYSPMAGKLNAVFLKFRRDGLILKCKVEDCDAYVL
uniref:Uncharacterized protein n=1 Tax=Glossina palpalis gambiensis TaxID=67801 RepID=A0A1B0ARZ1_9MUSC